jgi:hypothetical protein
MPAGLAKRHSWATGAVSLAFTGEFTQFADLAKDMRLPEQSDRG